MELRAVTGDITKLQVDAIVNAANTSPAGRRRGGRGHSPGGRAGAAGRVPHSARLSHRPGQGHWRLPPACPIRHPHSGPRVARRRAWGGRTAGGLLSKLHGSGPGLGCRTAAFLSAGGGGCPPGQAAGAGGGRSPPPGGGPGGPRAPFGFVGARTEDLLKPSWPSSESFGRTEGASQIFFHPVVLSAHDETRRITPPF